MKTVSRDSKVVRYFTQLDVAVALGISPTTFYKRVHIQGYYPKPTVRIGGTRRLYYTAEAAEKIIATAREQSAPEAAE